MHCIYIARSNTAINNNCNNYCDINSLGAEVDTRGRVLKLTKVDIQGSSACLLYTSDAADERIV